LILNTDETLFDLICYVCIVALIINTKSPELSAETMKRIFIVCLILTGSIGLSLAQDSSGVAPAPPTIQEPVLDNVDVAEPIEEPVEPEVIYPDKADENNKEKPVKEAKPVKETKVNEAKPVKEKKAKKEKVKEEKPPKEPKEPKNDKMTDNVVKLVGVALIGVAMWMFFSPAN